MTGEQAFVFDGVHTTGQLDVIGERESRPSKEIESVLTAEEGAIAICVYRFST